MTAGLLGLPRGGGRLGLRLDGPVAELVVDHPERRNAMSPGMMADLLAAVERLAAWDGVAVVIRGEGRRAFCAGGDLGAVRAHLLEAGEAMARAMQGALDRLAGLPVLGIAAVEGVALGGGAELLTAADVVVAAEDARIGFVHAALGVSPGWGGGARLARRVGPGRAARILAEARVLEAEEALRVGIVDEVVPTGEARARALAIARAAAANPPAAVRGVIAVAKAADPDAERAVFARLWGGPDHRAALARLPAGRRPPRDGSGGD